MAFLTTRVYRQLSLEAWLGKESPISTECFGPNTTGFANPIALATISAILYTLSFALNHD